MQHWLSDLEIFASLIGSIIHDYEHTGTTNNFHVQSRSNLAMLYNDRSVLENYHLSASFALMQKDEHNILANLTKEEYRYNHPFRITRPVSTIQFYYWFQGISISCYWYGSCNWYVHPFSTDKKYEVLAKHAGKVSNFGRILLKNHRKPDRHNKGEWIGKAQHFAQRKPQCLQQCASKLSGDCQTVSSLKPSIFKTKSSWEF